MRHVFLTGPLAPDDTFQLPRLSHWFREEAKDLIILKGTVSLQIPHVSGTAGGHVDGQLRKLAADQKNVLTDELKLRYSYIFYSLCDAVCMLAKSPQLR